MSGPRTLFSSKRINGERMYVPFGLSRDPQLKSYASPASRGRLHEPHFFIMSRLIYMDIFELWIRQPPACTLGLKASNVVRSQAEYIHPTYLWRRLYWAVAAVGPGHCVTAGTQWGSIDKISDQSELSWRSITPAIAPS